jgi:hypothetical protein
VDAAYVAVEDERAVIDRMAALRAEGKTYRAIADGLNGERIAPPAGREWHAPTVRKVLVREARA